MDLSAKTNITVYTVQKCIHLLFLLVFLFFFIYLFHPTNIYRHSPNEFYVLHPRSFLSLSFFFFTFFFFSSFFFSFFFLAWGNPEIPLTTDKRIPDNSVSRRNKFVGGRKLEKRKGIEGKKGNEERVTQRAI